MEHESGYEDRSWGIPNPESRGVEREAREEL